MPGIKDLNELLKSMKPELVDGTYVFCTVSEDYKPKFRPLLKYYEKEGLTLITKKEFADADQLDYSAVWALITLTVHSDLEAVGFLAKISEKLADSGISVNVVSAYYHDHLFVPFEKAEKAMEILKSFSE